MDSIAIIGMGCRFPGAQDLESYWSLLQNGLEAITEIPSDRWDVETFYDPEPGTPGKMNTRHGGFLEDFDQFDPNFFEMLPKEIHRIDPHQRLMLEVAWESLENAGLVAANLVGSQTGVFIGISQSDYNRLLFKDFLSIEGEDGTNTYLCFAANQLSYFLNLRGPSLAIDTACSSSLVATHLACQSLRSGECDLALAGGVNLLLSPEIFISLSRKGQLSPEGHCKTFDANADGFVRGEGCGILVLKRLSDAIQAGDHILATMRGSAVNQNGFGRSLSAPNGLAQQDLIRQALNNAGVNPNEISYVEAHGTGSYLGDSIEFQSLKAVLMEKRSLDQPCWFGSVKGNIGHLEAAAGIASLIKVVLSLQHKKIPPNLHIKQLNPYISLEGTPFLIPTDCQSWLPNTAHCLAGVSSLSFGGTNCHVILEEAPKQAEVNASKIERPLHLLTLSAKSEKALQAMASCYKDFLAKHPKISLADVCFTANTGRSHFSYRLAVLAESTQDLGEQLGLFAGGNAVTGLVQGRLTYRKPPKVAFIFPNESLFSLGMGQQFYQTQPTFRTIIDRCEEILRPYVDKPLLELIGSETLNHVSLEPNISTQAALFTVEYAFVELWKSWGIIPSAVMGYGVGEYVAACVAGVFSFEEGIKLITQRQQLKKAISVVTFSPPRINVISCLTGEMVTDAITTPEYWLERELQPVNWAESIKTLQQACALLVGIGFSKSLTEMNQSPLFSSNRDWSSLLMYLGELYIHGLPVNWSAFDQDYSRQRLYLPTYPFQRQRYWFDSSEQSYRNSSCVPQTPANPTVLDLLNQGDSQQLAQLLAKAGNFSEDTQKLLPNLLDVLVKAYQNQTVSEVKERVKTQNAIAQEQVDCNTLPALDPTRSDLAKPFVAPRTPTEQQIGDIWTQILKLDSVGIHDNFFELGGTSLLAVKLMKQIENQFGKNLPLATLFQDPTIECLAKLLHQCDWSPSWSSLVPIQPEGSRRPFFCVHPLQGNVLCYRDLAYHLGLDQPFYGLQSQGLDGKSPPYTMIEDMAAHYIREIQSLQPKGPYLLGGFCLGGMIAFEMAQQLRAQSQEVALLAMMDPAYPLDYPVNLDVKPPIPPENGKDIVYYIRFLIFLQRTGRLRQKLSLRLMNLPRYSLRKMRLSLEHQQVKDVSRANRMAIYKYKPKFYSGKITLFNTIDYESSKNFIKIEYSSLAKEMDYYVLPIHQHFDMLKRNYAKLWIEPLKKCIDSAEKSVDFITKI